MCVLISMFWLENLVVLHTVPLVQLHDKPIDVRNKLLEFLKSDEF